MEVIISESKQELGAKAASMGARLIQQSIDRNGNANIVVATGASQFEMLNELIKKDIDWSKVTCFHLDEYIGMTIEHPASFRKYLKERFVDKVNPKEFYYINAENNPGGECKRLNNIISQHPIDVSFVGIGENGHLAFNDPPADFEVEDPYIVVNLDEDCRKQQMGEGWFNTLEDVPQKAISMSIKQILKAKNIICSVPDARKSKAVKNAVEGEVTSLVPSSILNKHSNTLLYLDLESSALLK
ncbi:MAG: glucosamine-6-phosphate deaminase [Ignavibacteriae bacterium]|nr:glucosamine-6-phosphate deaminase [Ignavibacteriota bacterium]